MPLPEGCCHSTNWTAADPSESLSLSSLQASTVHQWTQVENLHLPPSSQLLVCGVVPQGSCRARAELACGSTATPKVLALGDDNGVSIMSFRKQATDSAFFRIPDYSSSLVNEGVGDGEILSHIQDFPFLGLHWQAPGRAPQGAYILNKTLE